MLGISEHPTSRADSRLNPVRIPLAGSQQRGRTHRALMLPLPLCIHERAGAFSVFPVPLIQKEMVQFISQERISEPILDHIVIDAPVPRILKESGEVVQTILKSASPWWRCYRI